MEYYYFLIILSLISIFSHILSIPTKFPKQPSIPKVPIFFLTIILGIYDLGIDFGESAVRR